MKFDHFWRPSWISALRPLFIFGNILIMFWGHLRNLKKLVWFSPGGDAKDGSLPPRVLGAFLKNESSEKVCALCMRALTLCQDSRQDRPRLKQDRPTIIDFLQIGETDSRHTFL